MFIVHMPSTSEGNNIEAHYLNSVKDLDAFLLDTIRDLSRIKIFEGEMLGISGFVYASI